MSTAMKNSNWHSNKNGNMTADEVITNLDELAANPVFLAIFGGFENAMSRNLKMYRSNDPRVQWVRAYVIGAEVYNVFKCEGGYHTFVREGVGSMVHNGNRRMVFLRGDFVGFTAAVFSRKLAVKFSKSGTTETQIVAFA